MILCLNNFKDLCKKILPAVDSSELANITEIIEIIGENKNLLLKVTNKEYLVKVFMHMDEEVDFHATVNANLFLKLVSQLTTETVSLDVTDKYLLIKANGHYKLPLIFEDDKLLTIPDIAMGNVVSTFPVETTILTSILTYNSKEIKDNIGNAVQKLYYIDQEGAITFTSGACVNKFKLASPVKLLLNARLVKLFKLFTSDIVDISIAYDSLTADIVQTKVRFISDNVQITSILYCDDSMINSVPVAAIRGRADEIYPYSVTLNRDELLQTINRLLLFNAGYGSKENIKPYSKLIFDNSNLTVFDVAGNNSEVLHYLAGSVDGTYTCAIDILDVKQLLDNSTDTCVNINFGNNVAITFVRNNIYNILPECTRCDE